MIIANPPMELYVIKAVLPITNRVDLVTGSGYDADTNRFGTIAATEVTIEGDALDTV